MRRLLPLLAFSSLVAEQPPGQHPQRRQFDFWLGAWEIRDGAGRCLGHHQVVPMLHGAVLSECWESGEHGGRSLSAWLPLRNQWRQTRVDDEGQVLVLEGGMRNGAMILEGRGDLHHRITWTPLGDGLVRRLWETSEDGRVWHIRAMTTARRMEPGPEAPRIDSLAVMVG